ncbi:hypothetical protein [Thalassotalea marina]|uniref:Uncharacterized protein n=1 Tax=Thalassotalea marina TaxID=1673741 RepID=A0A919BRQ9_9GAMM|nr:hypothetical protein [Thalassotalea marina]GHG07947.1 hypothetical protein GCM10017161_42170 [Thalassotalea marina]
MNSKTRKYVVNINRLVIFLLIVVGMLFDNNICGIIAAGYWLWLPNITRLEVYLFESGSGKSLKRKEKT